LRNANLRFTYLRGADLSYAIIFDGWKLTK
jgi:uncharacterized protein YjbI with pentapeptide repeats